MSFTSDYQAKVKARGWIYLPQLPANTHLGRAVAGAPGARSPNTPTVRSTYELAPLAVRIEQGFLNPLLEYEAHQAIGELKAITAIEDMLTEAAEKTGLDHGVGGAAAKAIGIPPWLLLLILLFALYALARGARLVPPLREVL